MEKTVEKAEEDSDQNLRPLSLASSGIPVCGPSSLHLHGLRMQEGGRQRGGVSTVARPPALACTEVAGQQCDSRASVLQSTYTKSRSPSVPRTPNAKNVVYRKGPGWTPTPHPSTHAHVHTTHTSPEEADQGRQTYGEEAPGWGREESQSRGVQH